MGRNSEAKGERERRTTTTTIVIPFLPLSSLKLLFRRNFFPPFFMSLIITLSLNFVFFLPLIPFLPCTHTIWNLFPVLKMSRTRKLSLKIHFTRQCTTCQVSPSFFPAIPFHYTFQISLLHKASFPLNLPLAQFLILQRTLKLTGPHLLHRLKERNMFPC